MVWFNVDDTLAFHRKVLQAGNAAMGLWVRAGAWSAGTLTDGFIPRAIARSMGTQTQIKALLHSGLWIEAEGGYEFHEWGQRQRTKKEVESRRESERLRKANQRKGGNVPQGHTPDVPPPVTPDVPPDVPEDVPPPEPPVSPEDSTPDRAHPFHSTPFPTSGDVGRDRYVSDARASRDEPAKFHPGHEDGYVPECADCDAARDAWEAHLVAWAQSIPEAPPTRCAEHRDMTGYVPACGACRAERRKFESWEAERDRVRRVTADHRRTEIAGCELCDETGWRIPPTELTYADPPAAKCDHNAELPAAWRALIAHQNQPEEAETHA
jgi:hypothetical protein